MATAYEARGVSPMTVLGRIHKVVEMRITDDQWQKIRPRVSKKNYQNVLLVSLGFAVMMVIMLLASFFSQAMNSARVLYVAALVVTLAMYGIASRVQPDNESAVYALMYIMISILLVFATVLGTVFNSQQVSTVFPAFVLASPLLFTDRRRRIALCIAMHTAFFVCMAVTFDNPEYVVDDVINSCIFSLASVGINFYLINVKLNQEYAQLKLDKLSKIDLLTDVHNRNSYERALAEYPLKCRKSLTCIFSDLNGLHELNEVDGHAEGDAMLQCLASSLRKEFGKKDTYRIGGDEFVVLLRDADEKQVERRLENVRREIEVNSCYASFGVATSWLPNIDVTDLVKRAERQMYGDKRRFYQREGMDRRGRID